MQPGGPSELFDSLKVYLNNRKRLQPIIGLRNVIECVNASSHSREALYLCEVCLCRLSKADMRNHIMGSLHRYNYIKAWHPHFLSGWTENNDLSLLAWPLMEIAKILEGEEGPGDVELLEIEDAVYQMLTTRSGSEAVSLIHSLRRNHAQVEAESRSVNTAAEREHHSVQSQRIVLLGHGLARQSEQSLRADVESQKTAAQTVASSMKPDVFIENICTSQSDHIQMSPEPSFQSKNGNSLLEGYTGAEPLIGLFRVLECRGEDGLTHCFLCHCCRVRINTDDVIDHITSSSHLVNYLTETRPEQVEALMPEINDSYQVLQSLARAVEHEEGRGELKVVDVPESLCILLTGKSYHWGVKQLCNGWTHADIENWKMAVKGSKVINTRGPGVSEKHGVTMSKGTKRMATKKKRRRVNNPVFKVSLPLTKGALLLERTSFSVESRSSTYSSSADPAHIPLPESQMEEWETDSDFGSFAVAQTEHNSECSPSQLQLGSQDFNDGDTLRYLGPEGIITVAPYFNQTEKVKVYEEINSNQLHFSQDKSEWSSHTEWQDEGLLLAVPRTQERPSYVSFQSKAGPSVEVVKEERQNLNYQHEPNTQHMTQANAGFSMGSLGHHGYSGQLAPHLNTAGINMQPYLGYVHSDGITPRANFLEIQQRSLQTYMEPPSGHFQTARQGYLTQPLAYQAIQEGQGEMTYPNYNNDPWSNHHHHVHSPVNCVGGTSHANAFIPGGPAQFYDTYSDLYN